MGEDDSIHIEFEESMFGRSQSLRLIREDIVPFMEMREIGARQILVYMGHLYKYLKEQDRTDCISFVDPGHLPTCPLDSNGSHLSQHIANQLEAVCRDSVCLIPYNTGYHWILTIVNVAENMIYLLDSSTNRCRDDAWKKIVMNGVKLYNASRGIPKWPSFKQLTGNLKQSGGVECGYYVMRYMKEIVECEVLRVETMFAGCDKNKAYSQEQFDEVRSEWSEFVYSHVGG
ncbi:uncharacterized protein [Henckelia pumila]|uniref:uncharacterized protein n=1 Tax=Henckelia pumila TaxID=405737 RepID=UPI003C6E804A